jgi:phosphoenolpyruvate-protein kinase (PTS system EI component)
VDDANEINLPISVCGDLAAREDMLPLLLQVGLRSISVPPAVVPEIKQAIRRWPSP